MKTTLTLIAILLITLTSLAQNGINYKAVIKDTNGNVVANQSVKIRFTILKGATNVYQETHTSMTDNNGIAIVDIGLGTPVSGSFTSITWGAGPHSLKVEIDPAGGNNFVAMGTTEFKAVPYALNVTGLEAVDEGKGVGWRLKGRNPDNYGSIGLNAVDLSYSFPSSDVYGATNTYAFAAGFKTIASGNVSIAFGSSSEASGNNSVAMGSHTLALGNNSIAVGFQSDATGNSSAAIGDSAKASGLGSIAMGTNVQASGNSSTAMGIRTKATTYASMALGKYNLGLGTSPTTWVATDPILEIGNGSIGNESNALTILKNGNIASVGNLDLNQGIDSGVALRVNGQEALWYNGTYFSWGFGGNANYFGDPVGIGTFSPNAGLHVIYNVDASPAGGGSIIIGSSSSHNLVFDRDEIMARNNGVVSDLHLQNDGGNVRVGGALVHSSDRRLKEDIGDLSYGLNTILKLQPQSYYWKNRPQNVKSFGLIAQDVEAIIPELVNEDDSEEKLLSINYTELIPILINAIKELKEENGNLKKSIQDKNTAFNDLSVRVKTIENLMKFQSQN